MYYTYEMRIDKYLKVTRIIKRREVAKTLCDNHYVLLNNNIAKPSSEVKENDTIIINSPNGRKITIRIIKLAEFANVNQAKDLYEVIEEE